MGDNTTKMPPRYTFGRRMIVTDYSYIDRNNVCAVLEDARTPHQTNRGEIDYLYNYYKGKQPALYRTKEIRENICNTVVVNRANEIVTFKVGYLFGEPIQYISRISDDAVNEAVNQLNEYMFAEDKPSKDKELAEWFTICGTAYRMILPDKVAMDVEDESPFEIFTLDPRNTFVVYENALGNKPIMGVTYVEKKEGYVEYTVYTKDKFFIVKDGKVAFESSNPSGVIPIIEYPANNSRLGAFEIVLPLLDTINQSESDRADAIEQFVQALMVLKGVDITSEDFEALKEKGCIKVPTDADVEMLISELSQDQTQTYVDDLYNEVLTICGMPNRNGGSSTSDTGAAVILRDGWSASESRAKDTELTFKLAEKQFLKQAIMYMDLIKQKSVKLGNIEIRFTRRNYENITEKSNVLIAMLNNPKIHPRLAFEHSGMFADSNLAYTESMEYYEEQANKRVEELMTAVQTPNEVDVDVEENENEQALPQN